VFHEEGLPILACAVIALLTLTPAWVMNEWGVPLAIALAILCLALPRLWIWREITAMAIAGLVWLGLTEASGAPPYWIEIRISVTMYAYLCAYSALWAIGIAWGWLKGLTKPRRAEAMDGARKTLTG
jgi:hypothetical protein